MELRESREDFEDENHPLRFLPGPWTTYCTPNDCSAYRLGPFTEYWEALAECRTDCTAAHFIGPYTDFKGTGEYDCYGKVHADFVDSPMN